MQTTQIGMAPAAAQPSDINVTPPQAPVQPPDPGVFLDSGGQLTVLISPLLTSFTSPDPPLSSVKKPIQALCLFHLPTLYSLNTTVPNCPAPGLLAGSRDTWLSTIYPSHKEWHGALAFPLSHAWPLAVLGMIEGA